MIVVDIETSGLSPHKHGMLSLGAVDLDSGQEFYGECQLATGRSIDSYALELNGFSEESIKDENKMSDIELFWTFVRFCQKFKDNTLGGHNIGHLDLLFLEEIFSRSQGILPDQLRKFPFSYRTVDLHSVFYAKHKISLSHKDICLHLGLEPEPTPHNALNGARSETNAFRLLL
jgi:DNA polymerase III epsilon subunit-like protein